MAAENEVQFFEAPFQYQIGEFTSNVNLTYHKLINTRPVKMPQMNTWFETPFTQAYNEKWDKSYFWIKKREWFQRCEELDSIILKYLYTNKYLITDHQIVDWRRFLMVCDENYENMIILKWKKWRYINCKQMTSDVCYWEYEVIWLNDSKRPLKTSRCMYHKFQKINTLQADEQISVQNLYIWNITLDWWTTTAIIFNKDRTSIDSFIIWKYIQVTNSDDPDIVLWQALQLWKFDADNWWYYMWFWEWVWITDEFSEPIYDNNWNKIWTLNYQWPLTVNLYDWIKAWLAFTWIWWRNWKEKLWIFEYNWDSFQFVEQTKLTNTYITSITDDLWWLVYTTNKWYLYFLRQHTDSMQTLWWTIYSSNYMYWWWDLAKSCWDYIFLFWQDSMWIAYKTWTDSRWDNIWNIQILDRSLWYLNKDTVMVYNEELYMIDNRKRFVKLDLEVTTNKSYSPTFKLKATDMSLHWINTDLRNIDLEVWTNVSLCKDDFRIYIIINDNFNDSSDPAPERMNTKILVYEDELKYRHRRYVCWLDIRWFSEWQWIWRWLFLNQWNYDCIINEPIYRMPFKEIISMSFWDTSWFTWKEVLWIKAAIWYHSIITEDTIFKFRADWWWFSKTIKMLDLHKTVAYIKAINDLRESWTTNLENLQMLYHTMPIWLWVYSWNWVWLIKDITRTPTLEFDQFCNYEPTTYYDTKRKCCDPKPASEPEGNGCTMKAPDADKENFWSDLFQYHYNVAKYSTIPIRIWQQWQNFYFELIANGYDEIEFCWFMVWWMFMDNNYDSTYNMPYYLTTPKDSLPWRMWK